MKIFKKIIISILSLVFILSSSITLTACDARENILRLYIPGEYITDEILQGFEDWYYEQTEKTIKVVKKEFDTNETMYTMIAQKKQDFDVICPSDYMAERMIAENLILKTSEETQSIVLNGLLGEYDEDNDCYPNQDFVNLVQSAFDPNLEYTAPYMWGTMGIMYYYHGDLEDQEEVANADEAKNSFKCLFEERTKKIYMKDSERDTYTATLFAYYYDDLYEASNEFTDFGTEEYQALLKDIFESGDNFEEKLHHAEEMLKAQKKYVDDYETDEGKLNLIVDDGKHDYYGMFWSCDAGYIMAEWPDDDTIIFRQNYRYLVPEEGSNVWIDTFCIPKYAGNKTAANYFLQYMCTYDTENEITPAIDAMDYVGCTSAVYQATVDYYDYVLEYYDYFDSLVTEQAEELYPDDITAQNEYIENNTLKDSFKSMYLSLIFPNMDIDFDEDGTCEFLSPLKRCGIMRNLGPKNSDDMLYMWSVLRRS